jgi:outer membrane protein assembly factor BamD (BamD/ComL family)
LQLLFIMAALSLESTKGDFMKRFVWVMAAVVVAGAVFMGCGKKEKVDTSKLEKSFEASEPAQRSAADRAVAAIKAGNYSQAMTELQKLAAQAKLTPEQQQAVKDVMARVQKEMTAVAEKAAKEAEKTASDLQKTLKR